MSKTQIEKTAQRGGSIFSSLFSLARPLIKPAVKALASAGLSFGAEKALKKIFGNGYGPNEIQLYKLVQRMTRKRLLRNILLAGAWSAVVDSMAGFSECLRLLAFLSPLI